jgi:hypothetical protein
VTASKKTKRIKRGTSGTLAPAEEFKTKNMTPLCEVSRLRTPLCEVFRCAMSPDFVPVPICRYNIFAEQHSYLFILETHAILKDVFGKSRETFIMFTVFKNFQKKRKVMRLCGALTFLKKSSGSGGLGALTKTFQTKEY